jgi:hypothetical protein
MGENGEREGCGMWDVGCGMWEWEDLSGECETNEENVKIYMTKKKCKPRNQATHSRP